MIKNKPSSFFKDRDFWDGFFTSIFLILVGFELSIFVLLNAFESNNCLNPSSIYESLLKKILNILLSF